MEILVPSNYKEWTGELQRCLLSVGTQGFCVADIQLGISPTEYFVLRCGGQSQRILRLSSDIVGCGTGLSQVDYLISYPSSLSRSFNEAQKHVTSTSQQVYIGVGDETGLSTHDVWMSEGVVKHSTRTEASACSLTIIQPKQHFCWLLSLLAVEFSIDDALILSNALCYVSRETWPKSIKDFPLVATSNTEILREPVHIYNSFPRVDKSRLALYPIVDSIEQLQRLLQLGVTTIQFRIKNLPDELVERQVEGAIALGKRFNAQLFINDYWELAVKYSAFGVHLGQEDLIDSNLEQIRESGLALGLSTHSYFELLSALDFSPSYIAVGPIFSTQTKQVSARPQGIAKLRVFHQLVAEHSNSNIATVSIGGVNLANVSSVWATGVDSVAVIGALSQCRDLQGTVQSFNRALESQRGRDIKCGKEDYIAL